jgi:hypothetical protein
MLALPPPVGRVRGEVLRISNTLTCPRWATTAAMIAVLAEAMIAGLDKDTQVGDPILSGALDLLLGDAHWRTPLRASGRGERADLTRVGAEPMGTTNILRLRRAGGVGDAYARRAVRRAVLGMAMLNGR